MNIFIISFGSRGDVQPYVALGVGLQAAGHKVTICTCCRFESFVKDHGLNYGFMNDDLVNLIDSEAGRELIDDIDSKMGMIKNGLKIIRQVKPAFRQAYLDAWKATQVATPDVIISGTKSGIGNHIAEKLKVPEMLAMPFPQLVPTAEFPSLLFPDLKMGWYNKLTYKFINTASRFGMGMMANEFRRKVLKIGKFRRRAGAFSMVDGRPVPILQCYSEHVMPRPNDWPDHAHVTGYWFLDSAKAWDPPADLQAFLDAGEPPVYIGFGSMAGRHPKRLTGVIVEALLASKVRGIIATGWGGLDTSGLAKTIFKVNEVPHDWLFQHVAAVVHHGGAGTTAAGLRAGKPTIICPFFADQSFWGARVNALGVGPKPIRQKKLTVEKLVAALREALENKSMRQKAEALGRKLRDEDGIARGVSIVEEFVASSI